MKLFTAHHIKAVGELALSIEGAAGALSSADAPLGGTWQQAFLGAPAIRIAGGSDEVQRNIIAERVLGLPRDRHEDRDTPFSRSGLVNLPTKA
jgi:alkylation response protein AidB-like acyl-CoA dehydrogenase